MILAEHVLIPAGHILILTCLVEGRIDFGCQYFDCGMVHIDFDGVHFDFGIAGGTSD